jgi:hypothetical protein
MRVDDAQSGLTLCICTSHKAPRDMLYHTRINVPIGHYSQSIGRAS